MTDLEMKLMAEAKRLLDEHLVDVFIGFRKENAPLHPQPAFFTKSDQLADFVYNNLCQNNLAKFLTRYPPETKIGMIVRGCENRSVNHLIVERQHPRENIVMIGVPCTGIYDWRKITQRCGEEISEVMLSPEKITVKTSKSTFELEPKELLHVSCARCSQPVTTWIVPSRPRAPVSPWCARARYAWERAFVVSARRRFAATRHHRPRCHAPRAGSDGGAC